MAIMSLVINLRQGSPSCERSDDGTCLVGPVTIGKEGGLAHPSIKPQ